MNEKQLQAKIIRAFSEAYTHERGLLFAVNNEANSDRQAMTFKALGVLRGASDLVYCRDGKLVGIEIKVKGKKHGRDHILNQYEWGVRVGLSGGEYYIVTSVASFFSVIDSKIDEDVYTLEKIYNLLNQSKSTIIF